MNQLPFKTIIFPRISCKIFGIMPYEILEDILIGLADNNERVLKNLSIHAGCFKQPKVIGQADFLKTLVEELETFGCLNFIIGGDLNVTMVPHLDSSTELIFLLAEHWCQDSTTKYQAVELLDRFMIHYVKQLYKSSTEKRNLEEIKETWASAKASLCENFILYLVSCIQISSKLNFHDHVFRTNVVIQLLRPAGYTYIKEDLLRSEMTVLKTLDFNVNIQSPFMFVEMLLEVIGYNGCSLPLKHVHDMCVMVLDLVYLLRDPIYDTILQFAVDQSIQTSTQRSTFLAVKEDFMLLGTGVIAASTFIINQNSSKQVLEHLCSITGITENSISEVCSAILHHSK